MTKIEKLKSEMLKFSQSESLMEWYITNLESAIREQVVIDALPTHEECKAMCPYPDKLYWTFGMDQMRTIATQRLTTREEVERPYVELLMELAGIALPYMTTEQKQKLNSLTDNK